MIRQLTGALALTALCCSLLGCASPLSRSARLAAIERAPISTHARNVCLSSGSSPIPDGEGYKLVSAADSTIGDARVLVTASFIDGYNAELGRLSSSQYVALCFVSAPPSEFPPTGRLIIAQLDDRAGSAFLGGW